MNITFTKIRRVLMHVAISSWERDFMKSLIKQKFRYTEKQEEIFNRIFNEYYPEPLPEDILLELTEFKERIWENLVKHEIKLIKLKDGELPF